MLICTLNRRPLNSSHLYSHSILIDNLYLLPKPNHLKSKKSAAFELVEEKKMGLTFFIEIGILNSAAEAAFTSAGIAAVVILEFGKFVSAGKLIVKAEILPWKIGVMKFDPIMA